MMRSLPDLFILAFWLIVGCGDENAFVPEGAETVFPLDIFMPFLSGKNPDQQGVVVLLPKELGDTSTNALS